MNNQVIAQYETEITEILTPSGFIASQMDRIELFANRCNEVAEFKQALINIVDQIQ